MTERSYNLGSYFIKSEVQDTLVYEDGSRIIQENAFSWIILLPSSYTSVSCTSDFIKYEPKLYDLSVTNLSCFSISVATDIEKHERFVTERSYNLGSYFIKSEVQDTLVYEDGSRIIQENAISFGEPVERLGPTLGDLARIGFSQTLKFEERITQENGDDILMENEAGRVLVEAPYEGVKISDISTLYPKESVSDLQEHVGRTMILNYPASVQSGV